MPPLVWPSTWQVLQEYHWWKERVASVKSALHWMDGLDTTAATIGRNAIPTMVGALVALGVVLAPIVLLMVSWVAVTSAFLVGFAVAWILRT